jgi:hypothetical protein
MTRKRQMLMLGSCVVITLVALASSVAAAAGKPTRRTVVVPAKTSLDIRLATSVASESNRKEDPVLASLAAPVIVDGVNVAPAASVLLGNISIANELPNTDGPRDLLLCFDRLRVGATTYDIRTVPIRYGAHSAAENGKDVRINSGTRLRVELEEALRMEVRLSK